MYSLSSVIHAVHKALSLHCKEIEVRATLSYLVRQGLDSVSVSGRPYRPVDVAVSSDGLSLTVVFYFSGVDRGEYVYTFQVEVKEAGVFNPASFDVVGGNVSASFMAERNGIAYFHDSTLSNVQDAIAFFNRVLGK